MIKSILFHFKKNIIFHYIKHMRERERERERERHEADRKKETADSRH